MTGHAETNRVEAFSDGVIAIVITLLVLEVKVPHVQGGDAELWHAIAELTPVIASWIISFLFVLVFWVNHHYFFGQLEKADRGLLWLNGLFLLCISFTPFPTALAGEYFGARPAMVLLSAAMFLTALAFSLMRWYAGSVGRLMDPAISASQLDAGLRRSLVGPTLYAIAIVLAFLWPIGAMIIQVLVPLIFFLRSPAVGAANPAS